MLTYVRLGFVHYTQNEAMTGRVVMRGPYWEIEASLAGGLALDLGTRPRDDEMGERALWAFPTGHTHGWRSDAPCERVVFHFSRMPNELERSVPPCGYYRVALSNSDCESLRMLAMSAIASHERPTEFSDLEDRVLAGELALMLLRSIKPRPLPLPGLALQKTQMALDWYGAHISEAPDQVAVARAVNVSPSYLRRLFHLTHDMSPKQAFTRLRMHMVEEMLDDPSLTLEVIAGRVGFASDSTLRRAIKAHFGASARQLRKDRRFAARNRFNGRRDLPR